jgi:hypothetical protein
MLKSDLSDIVNLTCEKMLKNPKLQEAVLQDNLYTVGQIVGYYKDSLPIYLNEHCVFYGDAKLFDLVQKGVRGLFGTIGLVQGRL